MRRLVRPLSILLTTSLLVLLAACGDGDEEAGESPTETATSARTSPATRTGAATQTPNELETVCADNPDPATDETTQVDEPVEGDEVTSPLTVRGRVAAFEATFQITLYGADGEEIADQFGMSLEGQTLAPFEEQVSFSVTEETPACLWVYESSARDGLPIHVVQIPVTLQP